ncbi:MAG: Lon protease family protein [Anaerolineales bacterium]
MIAEVPVERLYHRCDPAEIAIPTSQASSTLETIIGQSRAVKAMQFGLGIQSKGFNLYVSGMPGTGRTTAIKRFIEEVAVQQPVPSDWCYVNNFADPTRPNAIQLPAGRAVEFQKDMDRLAREGLKEIRNSFESEQYASLKEETLRDYQQQKQALLENINQYAQKEGFIIQATAMGLLTIPVVNGKPLEEADFINLPEEQKKSIIEKQEKLQETLENALRQARILDRTASDALQQLDRKVATFAIKRLIDEIKEKYQTVAEVNDFVDQVVNDILDNLNLFKGESDEEASQSPTPKASDSKKPSLRKYSVNVLVDNSALKGAPVVVEMNPTYPNLFGKIEQEAQFGTLITDFTLIRQGALHRANGGYLVLPVNALLTNPFAWENLKRALENQEIVIEEMLEHYGFATKSLRPEPIPLRVKIILIGVPTIFQLLQSLDEQFDELFKVKADFDTVMPRDPQSIQDYVAFVATLCHNENLKHLDQEALARFIEIGSRLAEDQLKLSVRFRELSDIIREAHFYAEQENADLIHVHHIQKAIAERRQRSSLIPEKIYEMIQRGVIKIDIQGKKVGQVNGLSVVELGDITFGQPSRITVSIGLGREGLIDIERESKLGGPIHTKGILILSGFLSERFAQDKPLSLSARLVFEQNYSGVDGDSASSTELYAILSGLSGISIHQGIAVTGSINQKGEIQAIGGVNEKIEGFFDVCSAIGFNGQQGVLIPKSNLDNLMLKEEVRQAVAQGKFHIWAVETVEEGIEVLTGMPAGERTQDGNYPPNTLFALVDERLREMAERIEQFGRSDEGFSASGEEDTEEDGEESTNP